MTQKPMKTGARLELEPFFAAEKATDLSPPDNLVAAVLRDARAMQPSVADHSDVRRAAPVKSDWFGDFARIFGGWPGALTLASCLIIGLSLGYTPPVSLWNFAGDVLDGAGISAGSGGYSPLEDMLAEG